MRHSRKSARVISLINQLQPGINVNEENQPDNGERGGEGTCCRSFDVLISMVDRIDSWWIVFLFFFFCNFFSFSFQHRRTSNIEVLPTWWWCSLDSRTTIQFMHYVSFQSISIQSKWKIVKSLARFSKAQNRSLLSVEKLRGTPRLPPPTLSRVKPET